jgi:RNA polymerase sigma factor (sigma-70 family)
MEIAIVAKVKQGYIYKYMQDRGYSASRLASEIGFSQSKMGEIINLHWIPGPRSKNVIKRLEEYFHVPIDILFPPEFTKDLADRLGKKHIKYEEIDFVALEDAPRHYLTFNPDDIRGRDDMEARVVLALDSLSSREKEVINYRFGFTSELPLTFDEISKKMGVTKERIRQIEQKALKKLQHKKRRDFITGVTAMVDDANVFIDEPITLKKLRNPSRRKILKPKAKK